MSVAVSGNDLHSVNGAIAGGVGLVLIVKFSYELVKIFANKNKSKLGQVFGTDASDEGPALKLKLMACGIGMLFAVLRMSKGNDAPDHVSGNYISGNQVNGGVYVGSQIAR